MGFFKSECKKSLANRPIQANCKGRAAARSVEGHGKPSVDLGGHPIWTDARSQLKAHDEANDKGTMAGIPKCGER